jgi:hypothetical protein
MGRESSRPWVYSIGSTGAVNGLTSVTAADLHGGTACVQVEIPQFAGQDR